MEDDIVQRLRAKELLSVEEDGYTHFLAKNPDGNDGAAEIERLRAENEKLRATLRIFVWAADELFVDERYQKLLRTADKILESDK